MRKLALAFVALGAVLLGFGAPSSALYGQNPGAGAGTSTLQPGGSTSVTVTDCLPGEPISWVITPAGFTPASGTATCDAGGTATIGPVTAPATEGTFTMTITLEGIEVVDEGIGAVLDAIFLRGNPAPIRPTTLTVTLAVAQQATTTTAATTTTTAATTTTSVAGGVPTTTQPSSGGLPATGGGDGASTTTSIAIGLLVVGASLFVVAQVRRRQTANPV
jgi:hypothetical protein